MKYVSIDTETLGLDPETCDLIEFAAVADDLVQDLERLPKFRAYIVRDVYRGEPYAMAMNAEILRTIADYKMGKLKVASFGDVTNFVWTEQFICADELGRRFNLWLTELGIKGPVTVAGKNFSGFDLPFLKKQPGFSGNVKLHHRCIDPGSFFVQPEDEVVPDTKKCMERAGVTGEVQHRALNDAMDVVRLVRYHFFQKGQ